MKPEIENWIKENYDDKTAQELLADEERAITEYKQMNEGYASAYIEKGLDQAEELDQLEMYNE